MNVLSLCQMSDQTKQFLIKFYYKCDMIKIKKCIHFSISMKKKCFEVKL